MTDEALLREAVRRITDGFRPERILLFGSRARGTAGADADFDFVVLVSGPADVWRLAAEIRGALRGLPASFDILVRERGVWQTWASRPLTLEGQIEREARVVYDAAA